jgi:signal transduction histidine kinase
MNHIRQKEYSGESADLLQGMRWLIRLRWLAVVIVIVAILISKYGLGIGVAYLPILVLTAVLLAYNIGLAAIDRRISRKPELGATQVKQVKHSIFAQIVIDLVLLTLMLHYAGGGENPLILFYIFHMTIASIMLSRRTAYLSGLLAVGLVGLLLGLEYAQIIPHHHPEGFLAPELYNEGLYILGVGGALAVTIMACIYLATSITSRLRERELELEQARQALFEESRTCEISLAQLNQLHQEKSEFMRKVAHELRAPLAAIKSCLQVAREYYADKLTGKPREMIERAERRSDGLMALVKDLLNLSRATEFLRPTAFKPVQLDKLLSGVVEFCRMRAEEQSVQLITQIQLAVTVMGDPQGLEEVFTNLLSNGIKYSPKDTKLTVTLKVDEKWAYISFIDQGIGIDPEDMPLLFTEFFRAKNAKLLHVEGTGLGLALSRRIVETHGGEISVESNLGKGSTFKLQLPITKQDKD